MAARQHRTAFFFTRPPLPWLGSTGGAARLNYDQRSARCGGKGVRYKQVSGREKNGWETSSRMSYGRECESEIKRLFHHRFHSKRIDLFRVAHVAQPLLCCACSRKFCAQKQNDELSDKAPLASTQKKYLHIRSLAPYNDGRTQTDNNHSTVMSHHLRTSDRRFHCVLSSELLNTAGDTRPIAFAYPPL